MIHLNERNGAAAITLEYAKKCLTEFKGLLYGVEMGIAYGGGVETIGSLWGDRGIVVGYDVFGEHPRHLAEDPGSREGTCMEVWYGQYGLDHLAYDYQRAQLDALGLDNVLLVEGEVHNHSCRHIPYLNYAFLDMDILHSMKEGYKAVKKKMVPGGFLFFHDVTQPGNLPLLYDWYHKDVLPDPIWHSRHEWESEGLGMVRKHSK